ncbi:glycoside hydrolase [Eremomyces bilateralis CBS 781.70]|uniref:Glycoside hydrolase n=1 Tax=Eremomyces bilateralis CBS 781.70 TaxID=1392243 RepID=A0A6G1FVL7_9PEZI|nr:glycoside hydrolase [Eremomyces bilateralis CBS 781.70]KAF1809758.1 glycoside hydrolase [Eremomyces bilateralis CBS 781.70]
MAPAVRQDLLPVHEGPRLILYYQTHHDSLGNVISVLPLITKSTGVTHVIVAAIHINNGPGNITLNDDPPDAAKFNTLWQEVAWLQGSGIKVMGMLGGAAHGSFLRLSGDDSSFEAYYRPLEEVVRRHRLDGLDLSIEEEIPVASVQRLLTRLRLDFGPSFILSLAPVATALIPGLPHLSGFSYFELETWCQSLVTSTPEAPPTAPIISFYSAITYCNWGDASNPFLYASLIAQGWDPSRIVLGLITNPANGAGHVHLPRMKTVLAAVRAAFPNFGGVMGWEYFNAGLEREGTNEPWEWAQELGSVIRTRSTGVQPSIDARLRNPAQAWGGQLQTRWKGEDLDTLMALGVDMAEAIQAMDAADGNVDLAASFLFDS